MRNAVLLAGAALALTSCADLTSTHTEVSFNATTGDLHYWSNKDQTWDVKKKDDGSYSLSVKAANTPGMTADEMATVITATGSAVGEGVGKLADVIVKPAVP